MNLGDYLAPAAAGMGISGVAAELNTAALGVELAGKSGGPAIPWAVLIGSESASAGREAGSQSENRALTTTANE